MKKINQVFLGTFTVMSNKLHISDPCYEYGSGCALTLEDVLNGKYVAILTLSGSGNYVAGVTIYHEKYLMHEPIIESGNIDIDSGQTGIFDDSYYRQNQGGEYNDTESFYGLACSLTSSEKQGGVMHNSGVVSSTGFGDGTYQVFIGKNKEERIISASVVFMED